MSGLGFAVEVRIRQCWLCRNERVETVRIHRPGVGWSETNAVCDICVMGLAGKSLYELRKGLEE